MYTSASILKGKIYHRGYKDGKRFSVMEDYKPYLFTLTKSPTDYKTIEGKYLKRKDFNSVVDAFNFKKRQNEFGTPVFGETKFIYPFLNDTYETDFEYDLNLIRILNFDIEVKSDEGFPDADRAEKEITAIACEIKGKYIVFGCKPYNPKSKNVKYILCKDESDLLLNFLDIYAKIDPDVLTGWNIETFDIPYLVNRINNILGASHIDKLSPAKKVTSREVFIKTKKHILYDFHGVSVLDYLKLYKSNMQGQRDSYKLDNIAYIELGEKKIDYSEYDSLFDLYKRDWEKFIDYNIKDVELISRLEDKLKLLEQVFTIAYDVKINFQDTFSPVRMWETIIHNYLFENNIATPPRTQKNKERKTKGAFVRPSKVGMHKWVTSFDLNSLYPHLIMQYNISPETWHGKIGITPSIDEIINNRVWDQYKDKLSDENLCIAATGDLYDNDFSGFLPILMRRYYDKRVIVKNKMIEAQKSLEKEKDPAAIESLKKSISKLFNLQMAIKIVLNAGYGATSNEYFLWFDPKLTESITLGGQLAAQWIAKYLNQWLNEINKTEDYEYIIAGDTDSIYITLDKLVKKRFPDNTNDDDIVNFLDETCSKILEPVIDKFYNELSEYVNTNENMMVMKREYIAEKAIFLMKKRYIAKIIDNEGVRYAEPKIIIKGHEAIKSSTPSICRQYFQDAIKIILNDENSDLIGFIDKIRQKFKEEPFENIASNSSCNNIEEYSDSESIYRKGTPFHVRGALVYNNLLEKHNIKKYQKINNGDKIKYCYLQQPNPSMNDVISVSSHLPRKFDLDKYIDYDKQFEKTFLKPLRGITDCIEWETEKKATLNRFFNK